MGSGYPCTLRCSKSGCLTPGSDWTAINFEPEHDRASTLVLAKTVLAISARTRIPVRVTGATSRRASECSCTKQQIDWMVYDDLAVDKLHPGQAPQVNRATLGRKSLESGR